MLKVYLILRLGKSMPKKKIEYNKQNGHLPHSVLKDFPVYSSFRNMFQITKDLESSAQ